MNRLEICLAVTLSLSAGLPGLAKTTTPKDSNPPVEAVDDSQWRKGPSDAWFVNWDKALDEARKTRKSLFVLNTGSDWCHWCKKLHAEVLEQSEFVRFAQKKLVLLYLDSPSRDPLGKEQKRHNREIVKTLQFGSGVPCAVVVSAKGKRLGMIPGGGQTPDAYIQRLERFLSADGQSLEGENAQLLFSKGYGALVAKIAAERAALPPVTTEDFKVGLSGVAVVEPEAFKEPKNVKFADPSAACEIPFGKMAMFKMEYEVPKGYGMRIFAMPKMTREHWERLRNLQYSPSEVYMGKGTAYGYLTLSGKGHTCAV